MRKRSLLNKTNILINIDNRRDVQVSTHFRTQHFMEQNVYFQFKKPSDLFSLIKSYIAFLFQDIRQNTMLAIHEAHML